MTERVELHLHTTASDDISVITPKDAIKAAMQTGHKAVAVTCSSTGDGSVCGRDAPVLCSL